LSSGHRERRQHPRADSRVEMEGVRDGGGILARMQTENLSLGGVYCSSSEDFPEMTRLAVRLRLPMGDRRASVATVDAEAVVVRREKVQATDGTPEYRLALFFTGLDPHGSELLEKYLARLQRAERTRQPQRRPATGFERM